MRRITVGITKGQYQDLNSVKDRHGITMSAQIRELIRSRMEGVFVPDSAGVRRTPHIWTKQANAAEVISINNELKELFERRRKG